PTAVVSTPRAVMAESASAARGVWARLLCQPGVVAAGVTFAVDEGLTAWDYHQGKLSKADFDRRTSENAVKATFVGAATQLIYIVAPNPAGLVVVAVGVITYVAADHAIAAYNEAFLPKVVAAEELKGIVPSECLGFPMIDDVATGQITRRRS